MSQNASVSSETSFPLISVIIRTQNRPTLLAGALRSVAEQDYPAVEAVVVNDGGRDIGAIVDNLAGKISGGARQITHEQARGRSAAANSGLRAARGEWIAFLDDDDVLEPGGLSTLADYIPWDKTLIYGQVKLIRMTAEGEVEDEAMRFGSPFNPHRLYLENYIPICAYLCQRRAALDIGGFDEEFEVFEDWDFLFRLSRRGLFHYVETPVARYRIWGDAFVTGKNRETEIHFRERFFDKHQEFATPDNTRRASEAMMESRRLRLEALRADYTGRLELSAEECRGHLAEHQKIIAGYTDTLRETREACDQRLEEAGEECRRHFAEYEKRLADAEAACQAHLAEYQKTLDSVREAVKRAEQEREAASSLVELRDAEIKQLEAENKHLELELNNSRQQLSVEHGQARELRQRIRWEQAVRQAQLDELVNKISSAIPFDTREIQLEKYGLWPVMRVFSGEEQNAHEVYPILGGVEHPLVVFQQTVNWKFSWGGRGPAHVLSFKMAAYSRINRCHLRLRLYGLDKFGESGELQCQARLDGPLVKDNRYAGFILEQPLPPGDYLCLLDSPDADAENALAIYVAPEQLEVDVPPEDSEETDIPIPRLVLPTAEVYEKWYELNHRRPGELEAQRREIQQWDEPTLISLIVPCYNSNPDWLDALLTSVTEQTYPEWECLLVDDASPESEHLALIGEYCERDSRFRLIQHEDNRGVSAACQTGLEAAGGEYIGVLDHDDLLEPQALHEMAKAIHRHQPDVLYSDEMLIDEVGKIIRCEFRPDFNYYFFLSHPYIIHLTLLRRESARQAGGFDPTLRVSQDYDLLARVLAHTRKVYHVPEILYQWRTYGESTGHKQKEQVTRNSLQLLNHHLREAGWSEDRAWVETGLAFNFFRPRHAMPRGKVSVMIPTRDRIDLLKVCIDSLLRKTRLPEGVELEIIVVDNGSSEPESLAYFDELRRAGHLVVNEPGPFNFSVLNNRAAARSGGDYLLLLNNDIEAEDEDWLSAMLELMGNPEVGIVGAKLVYPEIGLIQHAGVVVGFNGIAGHDHQFYPEYDEKDQLLPGHNHSLMVVRECLAVTAACMLVRREAFDKVGGMDEDLHVGFGDTDLCLKIHQAGYLCLYTPHARLIHHESASRGRQSGDPHPVDSALFLQRWESVLKQGDPFYNPNLTTTGMMFQPNLKPRRN